MGARLSGFGNALYDSKKKQFLGRDGAGWGKLGVFYFFFYLGLAGFFCAMLAVFMAVSPRDRPRYYSEESRMRTRSNPLAPGLGFRPQPEVDKNVIIVDKNLPATETDPYIKNLDQYLQVYYPKNTTVPKADDDEDASEGEIKPPPPPKFIIRDVGECTSAYNYGFKAGRPCVLVKMNKVVGFKPKPVTKTAAKEPGYPCGQRPSAAIPVYCYGEYPADVDNIGPITYRSEDEVTNTCGSLKTQWFPYEGKQNRMDVYQAPYVWVQFNNPTPEVLINVICRIYGENIDFDKKTARALTRFQIYVKNPATKTQRLIRSEV